MTPIINTYLIVILHISLASFVLAAPNIVDPHQDPRFLVDPRIVKECKKKDAPISDGGSDYTKPELETNFLGEWKLDNPNAGVAAMQLQLMPNDQVVWFDTTSLGPSGIKLPDGVPCPENPDTQNKPDCYAHAIAYDWKTSKYRTLTVCFHVF